MTIRSSFPSCTEPEQRGALDQLVPGEREEPALGRAVHRVTRAPDPLEEGGDPPWRAQLAHQVHVTDVDAQLQRRGGDERAELPVLEPLLGVEPRLLREAPVVRGDRVLAQPLGELPRHPLRQAAGIDEHERGAVRLDQLGQAAVDLPPDLAGHHGLERGIRKLEREVDRASAGGLDDLSDLVPPRRRSVVPPPPATPPPPRSAPSSPRARSAGSARRPRAPGAPGSGPGGRRAATPAPRGSRPR